MDELKFLDVDAVLDNHAILIDRYGGAAGLRDCGLLESAVYGAIQTFGGEFLNEDVFGVAAAYLHTLVNNHPFEDGNKRVGAMSALVFLDWNGIEIDASNDEIYELTYAVAESRLHRDDVADFLRSKAKRRHDDSAG